MQGESLKEHIAWLDKRIKEIDTDLTARLRKSEAWRVKDKLLQSIPGMGDTTSTTMLSKVPELGHARSPGNCQARRRCAAGMRQRQTSGQALDLGRTRSRAPGLV